MLLGDPVDYYELLKEKFPHSYLAEDTEQVIIGVECDYIDSYTIDIHHLQNIYQSKKGIAPFAGLFGILAYGTIHFFEEIEKKSREQYCFPDFVFADAKAYLHYDKMSKIYSFYGDKQRYYNFLEKSPPLDKAQKKKSPFYKVATNIDEEQDRFYKNVAVAKRYIQSGDIFQVVLSEQLQLQSNIDSLDFYRALKRANPSPYMFHFPTPFGDAVGSSPEILCEVKSNRIFIAPVAGTRPRGKDALEDERLSKELLSDEKELAEHRMLIDLARNDIGKFAVTKSVVVKNPMHINYYEHVMHIVSEVYANKRDDVTLFDLISAVFPAGTLSGTPKIRAMQIIHELEEYKRNAYGGGIGFLHYNGDMQLAILIRTALFINKAKTETKDIFVQAGAGIVYDSVPENEYREILHKRASVMNIFIRHCIEGDDDTSNR